MILDKTSLALTCPKCGKKFEKKLGGLKNDQLMVCPGCGQTFRARADQARSVARVGKEVEKALGALKSKTLDIKVKI
jgi:uncharacterized C2H2 Zn-finger protein